MIFIFDLDGTLLDTIGDLAESTNYALKRCGFDTHETSKYKMFVGQGINKLFEHSLPKNHKSETEIILMRKYFLEYYEKNNINATKPYDGIPELLRYLNEKNILIAVASNKYHSGTCRLVNHFFSDIKFTAIFGQMDGMPAKPNPAIVDNILELSKVCRDQAIFIGDSSIDMQIAKNANIKSIGVTWGFRAESELKAFSPEWIVDHPNEIIDIANKLLVKRFHEAVS